MSDPHLRAADSDRAAIAEALGQHMSAGRLTVVEYEERLERAYAARTYGELDELTADLPQLPTRKAAARVPAQPPAERSSVPVPHDGWGWDPAHSWRAWLSTALIVTMIWTVTSLASWQFYYFWPIWVIGPWGAVLLAQTITGRGKDDERPDEGRQLPG